MTICGTGVAGYNGDEQPATSAQLLTPVSVVVSMDDEVYIVETLGHRVRRIDRHGTIHTVAGTGQEGFNGDGRLAVGAQLDGPRGVFVTEDGEVLIADTFNHRIRKVDRNGMIWTVAGTGVPGYNGDDQLATSAQLCSPTSVFQYKREIYISDSSSFRIRKILQNGMIETVDLKQHNSGYDSNPHLTPFSVAVYRDEIFVAYNHDHVVRKILSNGDFETLIGNGKCGHGGDHSFAINALVNRPSGIFVDDSQVYIADYGNHRIRKIERNGLVKTIVGTGQPGYSGDVPFDFKKYPHIGPKKKQLLKPFSIRYSDIVIYCNDFLILNSEA